MTITRRTMLQAAAAFLAMPAKAQARTRPPVTVNYGPARLDIHAPQGARNAPVLFYLHGGGWRNGDRTYVQSKPEFFNGLGMVFVSADYRMLPSAPVPVQRADVAAALSWVRTNIAGHGGDPSRIVAMGHSAGAHLASLLTLSDGAGECAALISNDTGAYDIARQTRLAGPLLGRIIDNAFPDPALWAELSPASYATRAPGMPAMILWSAAPSHETLSREFAARLKPAHPVTAFDGNAFTHAEINRLIGTGKAPGIYRAIAAFLKKSGVL